MEIFVYLNICNIGLRKSQPLLCFFAHFVRAPGRLPDYVYCDSCYVLNFFDVLLRPRITEKATEYTEKNVYVFEVAPNATKIQIIEAVKDLYKVTPVKINITKTPAKRIIVRGKKGVRSGLKKALIFLKEGDKIDIV